MDDLYAAAKLLADTAWPAEAGADGTGPGFRYGFRVTCTGGSALKLHVSLSPDGTYVLDLFAIPPAQFRAQLVSVLGWFRRIGTEAVVEVSTGAPLVFRFRERSADTGSTRTVVSLPAFVKAREFPTMPAVMTVDFCLPGLRPDKTVLLAFLQHFMPDTVHAQIAPGASMDFQAEGEATLWFDTRGEGHKAAIVREISRALAPSGHSLIKTQLFGPPFDISQDAVSVSLPGDHPILEALCMVWAEDALGVTPRVDQIGRFQFVIYAPPAARRAHGFGFLYFKTPSAFVQHIRSADISVKLTLKIPGIPEPRLQLLLHHLSPFLVDTDPFHVTRYDRLFQLHRSIEGPPVVETSLIKRLERRRETGR